MGKYSMKFLQSKLRNLLVEFTAENLIQKIKLFSKSVLSMLKNVYF